MTGEPRGGRTPRGPNGRFERTLDFAERDAEACRMRIAGKSYQQIADALGYGDQGKASIAVRAALAAVPKEPAADLVEIEKERLDRLLVRAQALADKEYILVQQGRVVLDPETGMKITDDGPVLSAMKFLLDVQASRRRLLGLDAPASVAVAATVEYRIVGVNPEDMV